MRGWIIPLALAGMLVHSGALAAQDLKPPDPIPADRPGSPNAPQPVQPGEAQPGQAGSRPAQGSTQEQLEQAEREDSGRNFEVFWVRGELGGSYIDMTGFDATSLSLQNTSGGGFSTGIAAGLRLLVFTIGPRFRYHAMSDFRFAQIDGELGFHFGTARFDPFLSLHGGYSFIANGDLAQAASDVSLRGFNAGMSAGFDYYVSPVFTLGVGLTGEGLFLKRPPVPLPAGFNNLPAAQQQAIRNDPLYASSGSSAGFGITVMAQIGIHLGF
jgi:hypothetical protein